MHTLLLADESITVQRVIALTFAEQQITVVSVPDGQQAMEKMAAHRPDIVLAGTSLPRVSGYDLARFMRSKPDLKDVPVLLLTGAFEVVDDARLESSGADGVLEKPVEPIAVIGRVKELLGLKSGDKPATAPGRLITPAIAPAGSTTTESSAPRRAAPAESNSESKPAEDASSRGDYLDTYGAAFDTLDQHLAGRVPATKTPRNPSGPLGQSTSAVDPRSPSPRGSGAPPAGNPVYEVDEDWFGDAESRVRQDAKAGRREIADDLKDPQLQPAKPTTDDPIYEVDDEWFAEDEKTRAAKAEEQQRLAAEMGIHDIDLVDAPAQNPTTRQGADDLEFGAEDLKQIQSTPESPKVESAPVTPSRPRPVSPASPPRIAPMPPPITAPEKVVTAAPTASTAPPPLAPSPPAQAIEKPLTPTHVADDFAALLAFERGERPEPPMPPPPEVKVVTPEITDHMLDQIAKRVADRLTASSFSEELKNAMSLVMRDTLQQTVSGTVGPVVSETSERVVREVVSQTAERAVREVVSATTERVVREVVPQTAERVVRDIVPATAERVVREVVTETTERAIPDVVAQTTERVAREVIPQTTERVAREVIPETAERAVRQAVSETSERLVRDEIERIKSRTNS